MTNKPKLIGIKISPELHREFKSVCAQKNVPMAQVILEYIKEFIAKVKSSEA